MGEVLNVAALHDNGLPRATYGIRGNRFRLNKESQTVVALTDPGTDELLRLRALFQLSDDTLVEDRITDIEDLLDHLNEMVTTDEYWAVIVDDDGYLLIDDASEYPIVDTWSLSGTLEDLRLRVSDLETIAVELLAFQRSTNSVLNIYDARLHRAEDLLLTQSRQLAAFSAWAATVDSGLDHSFIVDD